MSGIQLLITGLCSFVPTYPLKKEEDQSQNENEITVLLSESAKPLQDDSGHAHEGHELHVPVLVCPEKYVVCGGAGSRFRFPDATFRSTPYENQREDNSNEVMAVFYLDDQEISILPDKDVKLSIDLKPVADCPTSAQNMTSFHWVAQLAEVNPGSEKVRPACLEPICDSDVISRLHLRQGHVTAAKLATDPTDPENKILMWSFEKLVATGHGTHQTPGRPAGRAIASIVGVDFDLETGQGIEFITSLLPRYPGHGTSNRRVEAIFSEATELRIRLEPVEDINPRVWIKNMPWLDILQIRPLKKPKCDVHFAHVYKLSEDPGKFESKVPCVIGKCEGEFDPRHGSGVDCPSDQRRAKTLTTTG